MPNEGGDIRRSTRRRWQFRIRSLLVLIAVVALMLVGYREIIGRLELEGPISTGRSPTIFFDVSHPDKVRSLKEMFGQGGFTTLVEKRLEVVARKENLPPIDFSVYVVDLDGAFCLKYDYPGWGRSRFDLRRFRYVFDVTDPVAQARNDAIEGAIFDASKEWAIDQRAVVRIEHHGRMHQIVTIVP